MTEHKNLAAALIAAQQQFGDVTKGKRVDVRTQKGNYSYTYADLGTVLDAVMPALHDNGLTIVQSMALVDGTPCILTRLLHADGEEGEIQSETPIYWADRNDTQKYGGAITYCRRYAIMALLCLNAEDDDGQQARKPPVVARDDVDQVTGEIHDNNTSRNPIRKEVRNGANTDEIKTNLIRSIMIIAGKIGASDEQIKEGMREVYRPNAEAATFSRKDLHIDELTEFLDKMRTREKRVMAERGRA